MTPEQIARLEDLNEKLADVFLVEADPDNWTGSGVAPEKRDPVIRGARNWDMKNANQAGALVMRAMEMLERTREGRGAGGGAEKPDDAAEADIARFEKTARSLLDKIGAKSGRT